MNRYKELLKNTFFLFVGQLASKFMTYFLLPLYTYVLTTSEYGIYDLVTVTISLLLPVITIDITEACFRYVMDSDADRKQIFSIGFYVSSFTFPAIMVFYPILSCIETIKENYIMFSLILIASSFNTFIMNFIKGIDKIKAYSLLGVIHTFILLFMNILFLIFLKLGITGYFLSVFLSHVVTTVCGFILIQAKKYIISPSKLDIELFKKLAKYSIPMIPNSICWWINNSLDKYILSFLVGTAQLGIYSVSYKIPSAMSVVSSIFMSAFSISVIKDFGSSESKKFFSNMYNAYFSITVSICAVIIIFIKPIASILFQKDFFVAWKSSVILIIAMVFNCLAALIGTIYTASKNTSVLFLSTGIAAIINTIFNIFLIPICGIYGAGIATVVSYMFVWLFRAIHSKRIIEYKTDKCKNMISIILLLVLGMVVFSEVSYEYLISVLVCLFILIVNYKNVIAVLLNKRKSRGEDLK